MGIVLSWILESSILIMLILGIRRIFSGKIRYAGIYLLWILVFVRFLIPVHVIDTPFSVANIVSGIWDSRTEKIQPEPELAVPVSGGFSAETVLKHDSGSGNKTPVDASEPAAGTPVQKTSPADKSTEGVLTDRTTEGRMAGNSAPAKEGTMAIALFALYALVSTLLFLWFLLPNLNLTGKLKKDRVFWENKGRIAIYTAPHVKTPCLYGLFRPCIYLPESLTGASAYGALETSREELEQMITHEYVHYRHRDHIWSALCVVFLSVYWYNPLVWLAVSCFKKDAELFCDETVIRMLGEERRLGYGALLLKMAGQGNAGKFRYALMPMSRQGKEMAKRIRAISGKNHYSKWIVLPLMLAAALTFGMTCSTGFTPLHNKAEAASAGSLTRLTSAAEWYPSQKSGNTPSIPWARPLSCEEAFTRYVRLFTNAVNTGRTDSLQQVLASGSEICEQQCALAKNYYKRGIREEILSCSITGIETTAPADPDLPGPSSAGIRSSEKIRVFYKDGTTKIVNQQYQYTCEKRNGFWMFTKMDEIDG